MDGWMDGWMDITRVEGEEGYSGNSLLAKRYTVTYLKLKMTFPEYKRKLLVKFNYRNDIFSPGLLHSFT
jgi:hypothetical protein